MELIDGLGGPAGFGEGRGPTDDDRSSSQIDLSAAFPDGISFYGQTYSSVWINSNGALSFEAPFSAFDNEPLRTAPFAGLYPFWADVNVANASPGQTPGGTSQGTNAIWYDIDAQEGTFTVTWDDVGPFNQFYETGNAFQVRVIDLARQGGAPGDVRIEFIYEAIGWTFGIDDAASQTARVGVSAGDARSFIEADASADGAALRALAGEDPLVFVSDALGVSVGMLPGNPIIGTPDPDPLDGTEDADRISGLEGDDTIRAAGGEDTVRGGDGADDIDGGTDGDAIRGEAGSDLLRGGDGPDTLWADRPFGGAWGRDILEGGAGNDTLWGTNGPQFLRGEDGDDVLDGGEDWLTADRDTLLGGEGDDLIRSGQTKTPLPDRQHVGDWLEGQEGADTLIGGAADDGMSGGTEADLLEGGGGTDIMQGGAGDDVLWADADGNWAFGFDTLYGDAGADRLTGANGAQVMYGDADNDTLNGGNDWLTADQDRLFGGAGDDLLISGQTIAPTALRARFGDLMDGGRGDDTLESGQANDRMTGAAGADDFVFRADFGADQITDFDAAEGDRIVLAGTGALGLADLRIEAVDGDTVIEMLATGDTIRVENSLLPADTAEVLIFA